MEKDEIFIKEERMRLMNMLLEKVGINGIEDGLNGGKEVDFEQINEKELVMFFYEKITELRQVYPSKYLTALHENSFDKKFPGSNMLRQILRYNNYDMRPIVRSMGYKNKKKIVKRTYRIEEREICQNKKV
jgi:hypothetical protein